MDVDRGEEEDEDEQEEVVMRKKKMTKKEENEKKNDKKDIVDFFNSYDSKERDRMVQILNTVLMSIFPSLKGDEVTFIGSTFLTYGEKEPYLNHCLVVGSCDDIPGAKIECVYSERELLTKWSKLIQKEDPDIIIGYNIFGFDYEFMFRRSQETHCVDEFLKLSRKKNEICGRYNKLTSNRSIENTKIVLSTGEYDLKYPKISGRIQIDMFTYFRRDYNLTSYKLDDVAGLYISDKIIHCNLTFMNGEKRTELFTKNVTGLHIDDYIHIQINSFTSDYYKNGYKFKVIDIIKNVKENIIIIDGNEEELLYLKTIKWCIAKDNVSVKEIFDLAKGNSTDRARVAKYCIQDCNLVHQLFNKIDVITGYVEMSRICSVPISYLIFRGQGIKLTSYVAKQCRKNDTLMPDLQKTYDNSGYEGAIVLPPKCAMYLDNPIACVDYASLYPASMISQNFSHDSKVWTKEYNLEGNIIKEVGEKNDQNIFIYDNLEEKGYTYIDIEFDTYEYKKNLNRPTSKAEKKKIGKKICRWVQLPNNKKSIMPSILEELLLARATTRKLMKTIEDPFMKNILDKRQLGYKVTANSLYGQCGATTSTFYEKDIAASTTATGRMMIIYAQSIIEKVYGNLQYTTKENGIVQCNAEYVYGDTDSVFFTFNLKTIDTGENIRGKKALEITIEIAQDAAKLCTQFLKPPMELTYEKTLMQFILLAKKRYVGILYEKDPMEGKMKFMGLSIKRRDSCDYLKDTYGGILNILMTEGSASTVNIINNAIEFLNNSLLDLKDGKVSMDKLSITKALRGYYKKPLQIAHNVLAQRIGDRDPGNKPKSGDRMQFIHIVSMDKKALQGDKIETLAFVTEAKLSIDYTFYITHQLMKPLQQLFGLALQQICTSMNKVKEYEKHLIELKTVEKSCSSLEEYMKKKEKICSTKVKCLLFDSILIEINNRNNGDREIRDVFPRK